MQCPFTQKEDTIPSPLLISSLAHSPPLSISTIHLGQGFPNHLFLLRPYKRYLFIFPPKQFPSPCTIYLPCIFSIFCMRWQDPTVWAGVRVTQENGTWLGKAVKWVESSAFHSLFYPSTPFAVSVYPFWWTLTTCFEGKPFKGRKKKPGKNNSKHSLWHEAGKLEVGKEKVPAHTDTHTHHTPLPHRVPLRGKQL